MVGPGPDFFLTQVAEMAAELPAAEYRAQLAREDERRRAEEQAASALSNLRAFLLLEMTDDELEGRVPLREEFVERWWRAFPHRPIIDGHVATARQMERLEELQEREQTFSTLKRIGYTDEQARAQINVEYGDRSPAPTPAPVPRQAEAPKPPARRVEEAPNPPAAAAPAPDAMTRLFQAFGMSPAAAEAAAETTAANVGRRRSLPPSPAGALAADAWARTHGRQFGALDRDGDVDIPDA